MNQPPPDNNSQSPVLDWPQALEVAGGDAELAFDVLSAAVEELLELSTEATAALGQQDYSSLQRIAHRLKGAALAIASKTLHAAAEQLESASQTPDPTTSAQQLQHILTLIQQLEQELKSHRPA